MCRDQFKNIPLSIIYFIRIKLSVAISARRLFQRDVTDPLYLGIALPVQSLGQDQNKLTLDGVRGTLHRGLQCRNSHLDRHRTYSWEGGEMPWTVSEKAFSSSMHARLTYDLPPDNTCTFSQNLEDR